MPDIVIAGAGVVGLAAALLLAKDHHRVTVLERDRAAPAMTTSGISNPLASPRAAAAAPGRSYSGSE